MQENSYPKKRDLSYVAARSLNYKTHDKNKTSAPVSATGADGYRVVETIRLANQQAWVLALGSVACNMTVGHNRAFRRGGGINTAKFEFYCLQQKQKPY